MKKIVKLVLFLCIGFFMFLEVHETLLEKTLSEKSSFGTYLNYKDMERVDVLVLGSSHSDNGIGAIDMENQMTQALGTEVCVFNHSIYGMRMEQMHYVLKELLKTQNPKVIVIETFSFVQSEPENREIIARRALDYLPLNLNKVEAVRYCTDGNYASYLIPMIKYHTRWKELSTEDIGYRFRKDLWHTYGREYATSDMRMEEQDDWFMQDFSSITQQQPLGEYTEESLQAILSLTEERHIPVLFLAIPYKIQLGVSNIDSIKMNNYVRDAYVNGNTVQMLDLNKQISEIGFGYEYLYDEGHMNLDGAKKITHIVADFMITQYGEIIGGMKDDF